ncbi:hypothetical protein WMF27_45615 [Sorangium sp. So ce281]|uniref:hypothetical protein n=1 Tax=Sorangium sp. So ce281 TaxID=3133293 RepID=UPI003F6283D4
MGLVDVTVLAAVQGAAQALPISATGHGAAARLWLRAADGDAWVAAAQALATAAASALRALAERRRVGALSLWVVRLGLAMVAYARALPGLA